MANTTWNNADKTGVTLSGTNSLTATTSSTTAGVRTIDLQGSGKFYFEYICTTIFTVGTTAVGVANATAVLSTVMNTATNAAVVYRGLGAIWVNNTNTGSALGTLTNGNVIGVALDVTSNQIWFRVAPSGNWNGSGTANPATPLGGISITSVASGLFGYMGSAAGAGVIVTGNFGDTAFSGAVPSGFTSGFPTGGVAPGGGSQARAAIVLA